ncbi:Pyrimidine pathway regulatory protein 1 [Fusarium oxysporum f. sp. cubense race 1]|uniref:Pyrimidine pathway regulatory protein 1 n=1 Tax=Fusarium oxysporum f. sp. cubense (strain race 1) TaxID=1229664 RepID=N4U8S5_FUSC1|nr:Pyrimidine pathway regulatory protein 1 [Fusarium oxysporum f. sp. cubense race 1]
MSQPPRKRARHTSEADNRPASAAACERCRSRKVKCGAEFPICKGCLKASTPCIIADPSALRPYTREEVFALEQKLKDLQERAAVIDTSVAVRDDPLLSRQATVGRIAHPPDVGRYVGQDTGVSFLLSRLHSASDRLQQGSSGPLDDIPTPLIRIEYHSPHPFPAYDIAIQAIDHYFKEFHVAHPLLKREVLQSCLEQAPDWTTQERINLTAEQRHDIFQLYMAIAIGSIRLFRDKTFDQHPFGFFSAALEMNPPAESRYNTLGNIENLILIARFGVYYNIGCSLWELSRLCSWHESAPFFDNPSCLFETREFFELTYQEERLRLIRATIEVLGSKTMLPPDVLLEPCLQAARAIICSFAALRGLNMITFSRAYMHLIFTAALVIVVVLETRIHRQEGPSHKARSSGIDAEEWLRDLVDNRWNAEARDIWNDLSVAGSLLSWFADSMPDMAVYNQFFQRLRHQLETAGSSGEQPTQLVLEGAAPGYETHSSRNTPPSNTSNAENNTALNRGDQLDMGGMNILDLTSIQIGNPQLSALSEDGMPEGWPLAYVLGVEGISAGLSEFVWDTVVPWEESPARSSEF